MLKNFFYTVYLVYVCCMKKDLEIKCTLCKSKKNLDCFHNRKTGKYGKSSRCKECTKNRYEQRYRDKALIKQKEYYLKNKDKKKDYAKSYNLKNRDKLRRKLRKYRLENPDKCKKIQDDYYKANKKRYYDNMKKYRSSINNDFINHDSYIKNILYASGINKDNITKDMIDAKRCLVKINRLIKNKTK